MAKYQSEDSIWSTVSFEMRCTTAANADLTTFWMAVIASFYFHAAHGLCPSINIGSIFSGTHALLVDISRFSISRHDTVKQAP